MKFPHYPQDVTIEQVAIQAFNPRALRIERLCTMPEFRQSVAQMILLTAGEVRKEVPSSTWAGVDGVNPAMDADELWSLTGSTDWELQHRVCSAAWHDRWPTGLRQVAGYANVRRCLEQLGTMVCFPIYNGIAAISAAHGTTLCKRMLEVLPELERRGIPVTDRDRLIDIAKRCGRGETFIAYVI